MKKSSDILNRSYRILAVAILFFAVGTFLFFKDKGVSNQSSAANDFQVSPGDSFSDPIFSHYPSPSIFQKFSYNSNKINNADSLPITASCNDFYVTILIFPINLDYRRDVSKAAFNKAFGCERGKSFLYQLSGSSLGGFKNGDFYLIIADQGESGTWYNPR